ncbi:MAG TPA: citrate synthase family protein, partial [Spirillospora sp.]|nr:citrate synthase family protein [Spirillospora sp.]
MNQYIGDGAVQRYMTAQEVADELGISRATVYAYVSRGLLRSEAVGSSKRTRRYYREDVERLRQRQEQRHHPEKAAEAALHFGAPLLESGLTLIADGRLYYRGQDVLELAQRRSIEQVAALLWAGDLHAEVPGLTGDENHLPLRWQLIGDALAEAPAFERFQVLLPLAALDDLSAYDLRPANVMRTGGRILRLLAATASYRPQATGSIASVLQAAWKPDDEKAADLINMALVLCADHELNVSSFTARCVASAGATPYAVVIGGLAALQGARHGGATERVAALLREVGTPEKAGSVLASRLRRGEALPGFGHRLYPDGDPRGRLLLNTIRESYADAEAVRLGDAVIAAAAELTGLRPTIDLGLVIL